MQRIYSVVERNEIGLLYEPPSCVVRRNASIQYGDDGAKIRFI